jgi:hypothetical protein
MENEYMKRGYLLPEGCKDLSDVAKLKQKYVPDLAWLALLASQKSSPLTPIKRQVFISPNTTVKKLATLLGKKPFEIVCDLVQLGTFASVDDVLQFVTISAVARMHGFEAIKAG